MAHTFDCFTGIKSGFCEVGDDGACGELRGLRDFTAERDVTSGIETRMFA